MVLIWFILRLTLFVGHMNILQNGYKDHLILMMKSRSTHAWHVDVQLDRNIHSLSHEIPIIVRLNLATLNMICVYIFKTFC